jgi:hypothetical protein
VVGIYIVRGPSGEGKGCKKIIRHCRLTLLRTEQANASSTNAFELSE